MKHDTTQTNQLSQLTNQKNTTTTDSFFLLLGSCCILLCSIFCHQIAIENKTRCQAMLCSRSDPATKWRSKMQHSNTNGDLINNSHIYVLFWWFLFFSDGMGLACFSFTWLAGWRWRGDGFQLKEDTGKRFFVLLYLASLYFTWLKLESNWSGFQIKRKIRLMAFRFETRTRTDLYRDYI